jgi:hypothetical protein
MSTILIRVCAVLSKTGLLVMLALIAELAWCQTAKLQGRVTDPSGAVIPAAHVSVVNSSSGVKLSAETNQQGEYSVPFLPPGEYEIQIIRDGFKAFRRTGVHLEVDQTAAIDLTLEIGAATQTVEVSGESPLLQTQTASVGQTIDNKTVSTLPLNGRDYTQLVTLAAGAAPNTRSRAGNGFSLNGSQTFQNTMLLDGVDNNNYLLGADSKNMNALTPSIDAIQEFHVETSNYSAQYGRSAGGIVSVSLKSGTNQFHGDAFEFFRNTVLNANDFFANRGGLQRPPLHRNQFGGVVGGPIVRNRSFFFVSYQGQRQVGSTSGQVTVPTVAEVRDGNFGSINIYNPASVVNGVRTQFTGNIIPLSQRDPVGVKLASLYPAPNAPGLVNNYAYNQLQGNNANQIDSRFDEQLTGKDTMFFSFSRGASTLTTGSIFASPGNGTPYPNMQPLEGYSLVVSETHTFTGSLFNEFHIGYTHNSSNQLAPETQALFSQFGINGVPPAAGLTGLPNISVTGFSGLGDNTFLPNPKLVQVGQLNDTVSWLRGSHTITFGGQVLLTHNYAGTSSNARSSLSFNGQFTSRVPGTGSGLAVADLLLGQTNSASISTFLTARFRSRYYGGFVNDSWRVTPKLTLNLGVRYDLQTPMVDRDDRLANFVFDPASSAYGTLVTARGGDYLSRSFNSVDTNNFAPRIGIAYQVNSKIVVRSAFGIFYGGPGFQAIAQSGAANPPFFYSVPVTSATNAAVSSLVLSNGFPSGFLNPGRVQNPNVFSTSAEYPMPIVDQWNFTIERQLPANSVLTLGYVGNSASHLLSDNNLNAPVPGPGATNARRPFTQFGELIYQTPYAHSTYEGLQVTFQKRYAKDLSILANYTWSHSIDNVHNNEDNIGGMVPQNPFNTNAEKGNSGFDIPQRFVANVVYNLPVGRPGTVLSAHAWERQILGGWQIGGIVTAQKGAPVTPSASPNPASSTTPERPDRVCDGTLAGGQRTIDQWFNVACYQLPGAFMYGNSGRGVIRSPGLVNADVLIDRMFTFNERFRLEFRSELFNVTNTAHFGDPNVTIGVAQAGRISTTSSPNRQVEFALRLLF